MKQLIVIMMICCASTVWSQTDSSIVTPTSSDISNTQSDSTIAPVAATYNLPPVGVTTGGQFFAKVKYIKSFGGSQADFFGPITGWALNPSFISTVDNEDYYVYDCGKSLKKAQEFCIDIGGIYMPQIAIDKGDIIFTENQLVLNGKKNGKNYNLTPEDYGGVIFTPK